MSKPLRKCSKCGLEAWTTEDLVKFCNDKGSKHKKRNLCLKCNKNYMRNYERKPPKPKPSYLRKCVDCGLEAHAKEDLKLFRFSIRKPHKRDNWCLDCYNKYQKTKKYVKKARDIQKEEIIENFEKPLRCYFCGELITIMEGKKAESFAGHSLDGNHWNFEPENKVPTHRGCHSQWHSTGDRNPKRRNKKKGDNPTIDSLCLS